MEERAKPQSEQDGLRAELEALRRHLDETAALRRQLDATRAQLRRADEKIERRDVNMREARAALEPECALVTFGPDRWRDALEDAHPHLLLVESDSYANDGGWQSALGDGGHGSPDGIRAVIEWCRERQIPTAFWHTAGA